jgi:hypothetical protein
MQQNIKVQDSRLIMYVLSNHERKVIFSNLGKRHNFKVGFSHKVRAKILEICEVWAIIVDNRNKRGDKTNLSFLTLTLPARQVHCDKTIVSTCLLPFLRTIGNYLYVCEKQENGNIHFHVITDTTIRAGLIRKKWNMFLDLLSYCHTYQRERKELYKNGFHVLSNDVPFEVQKQWYDYGVMSNWSNPRTVDLQQITDISGATKYITKYITKGTTNVLCCKKWGASKEIAGVKSPKFEPFQYDNEDIENLINCSSSYNELNEYVQIYGIKNLFSLVRGGTKLYKSLQMYFLVQEKIIYP